MSGHQQDDADGWFVVEWSRSQQYVNVATLTETLLNNYRAWRENRKSDWVIVYASRDEKEVRQIAANMQALCHERRDAETQSVSAENN